MKHFLGLIAISLLLVACAPKKETITIVTPPKSAEDTKVAQQAASHIIPVYYPKLMNDQLLPMTPEQQQGFDQAVRHDMDKTPFDQCLLKNGFSDYMQQRLRESVSPQNMRSELANIWVKRYPTPLLTRVDQDLNKPVFRKILRQYQPKENVSFTDNLKAMRAEGKITDAEANEFLLDLQDRDMKAFFLTSRDDLKLAAKNLLTPYLTNPVMPVQDFLKSHPAASSQCNVLDGAAK